MTATFTETALNLNRYRLSVFEPKTDKLQTDRRAAANRRLAQWGLNWFIESLCFYCKFVLADNLVFQNPPLRQAWELYGQA
jgi:hypothetical protein